MDKEIGIVITCFNRPQYTKQCFESFKAAKIPFNTLLILIDDNSTDPESVKLFKEFDLLGVEIIKQKNTTTKGIKENLIFGFNKCFKRKCSIVMNFDNDAIIKPNAITKLVNIAQSVGREQIITGFNCNSKNSDGSFIHPPVREGQTEVQRKSVGGINMCFKKIQYEKYILPALQGFGNWDHNACLAAGRDNKLIYCIKPSVVQHIGLISSLQHNNYGNVDIADDFNEKIDLPSVTLLGIDCINYNRLEEAIFHCTRQAKFAEVKMLTSLTHTHPIFNHGATEHRDWINIPHISNKEQYSKFCMKHLNEYVDTEHVLLIQWDGYILNTEAWDKTFLEFDYIGASWGYKDNMNVGNGGFSLRSKKLLKILATDPHIEKFHPEDHHICRTYRPYLEKEYGIKFAPEEVANRFAIEAFGSSVFPGANKYSGQFGFHGFGIDYSTAILPHKPIQYR